MIYGILIGLAVTFTLALPFILFKMFLRYTNMDAKCVNDVQVGEGVA